MLKATQPAGILPAIPFGWAGERTGSPGTGLHALVCNLLGNLLEDGFTSVHVLTPPGLDLGPGIPTLKFPGNGDIPLMLPGERDKVVILPIGHTEQHGYHSPLSTDTLIIEAIAQGHCRGSPGTGIFPAGLPLRGQHTPALVPRYLQRGRTGLRRLLAGSRSIRWWQPVSPVST